jgi:hypothetical protein
MAKAPFDGVDRKGKGKLKTIHVQDLKSGVRIIFGPVRLSFLNVFKPRKNEDRDEMEYSLSALIDKGDEELLDYLEEQIDAACKKKFGKLLPKFSSCLMDGDEETDKEGDPKAPGCFYISIRTPEDQPPVLIGPDGRELDVSDARHWNSGDWGYVKVDMFGYDTKKNGVSTRLLAVNFTAKDESFGGVTSQDPDAVKKEFGAVEGVDEKYQKARDEDEGERSSRRRERSRDSDDGGSRRSRDSDEGEGRKRRYLE